MTSSVLVIVIVVVAGVLYLLLRRRGASRNEEMRPLPGQAKAEEPDLKPFRPAAAGLPPKPKAGPGDSGSSHPAYPVAPAKYSGAQPVKAGSSGRHEAYGGGTVSRPELDPVAEARKAANAPAPTEPWYPQAPASYTEGDEAGEGTDPGRRE